MSEAGKPRGVAVVAPPNRTIPVPLPSLIDSLSASLPKPVDLGALREAFQYVEALSQARYLGAQASLCAAFAPFEAAASKEEDANAAAGGASRATSPPAVAGEVAEGEQRFLRGLWALLSTAGFAPLKADEWVR